MNCATSFDAGMACEQHRHCATCSALLDDTPNERGHFYTCDDHAPPVFPADDPMTGPDRMRWEWELR